MDSHNFLHFYYKKNFNLQLWEHEFLLWNCRNWVSKFSVGLDFFLKNYKIWIWIINKSMICIIVPGRMITDSSFASLKQKSISSLISSRRERFSFTCNSFNNKQRRVPLFIKEISFVLKKLQLWHIASVSHHHSHGPFWFARTRNAWNILYHFAT